MQARVAGALRKLSANDENKHEIASSGGIEMLIHSSEIHLNNAVVQAGVAGALSNLSVDDDIEQQIAGHNGIEVLIKAAKAHLAIFEKAFLKAGLATDNGAAAAAAEEAAKPATRKRKSRSD